MTGGTNAELEEPAVRRRVPLVWWILAGVALLAAGVAVAGGFADAGPRETVIPELSPGATHSNDRFAITLIEARIGDEIEDAEAYPGDGERVLAITVDIENLSGEAFSSTSALNNTFVVRDLDEDQASAVRSDDGTRAAWLQPEIPTRLVLSWPMPEDFLSDGEAVRIDLFDPQKYEFSTLGVGTSWGDVVPGAYAELPVEDIGTGSEG